MDSRNLADAPAALPTALRRRWWRRAYLQWTVPIGFFGAAFLALNPPSLHGLQFENLEVADGVVMNYAISVPERLDTAAGHPTLLALPPGGQDRRMVEVGLERWLPELERLGWIVVSPASIGGRLYFQGAEQYLPALMDHIAGQYPVRDGKFYVFGISNGGISSFRLAALYPQRVHSITVIPGYPVPLDFNRLERMKDIPVSMIVGEQDGGWVERSIAAQKRLEALGGNVSLEIVPRAGHRVFHQIAPEKVLDLMLRN